MGEGEGSARRPVRLERTDAPGKATRVPAEFKAWITAILEARSWTLPELARMAAMSPSTALSISGGSAEHGPLLEVIEDVWTASGMEPPPGLLAAYGVRVVEGHAAAATATAVGLALDALLAAVAGADAEGLVRAATAVGFRTAGSAAPTPAGDREAVLVAAVADYIRQEADARRGRRR